jgi:hypothetical protein
LPADPHRLSDALLLKHHHFGPFQWQVQSDAGVGFFKL